MLATPPGLTATRRAEPTPPRPHNAGTTPCKFYAEGALCRRGAHCWFQHDPRGASPHFARTPTFDAMLRGRWLSVAAPCDIVLWNVPFHTTGNVYAFLADNGVHPTLVDVDRATNGSGFRVARVTMPTLFDAMRAVKTLHGNYVVDADGFFLVRLGAAPWPTRERAPSPPPEDEMVAETISVERLVEELIS